MTEGMVRQLTDHSGLQVGKAFLKWNPPRPPAASTPPLEGIF
jgi:hypothetical protein